MNYRNDPDNMYDSIKMLPQQIKAGLNDRQINQLKLDKFHVNKVLIIGMGSSLTAFKILAALFEKHFIYPVIFSSGYLPEWVDKNTLIILSSYSGESSETLAVAKLALKQNCLLIGITTGGKLSQLLKKHHRLCYKIEPDEYNPCQQPRTALGFSLAAYFNIFKKINLFSHGDNLYQDLISAVNLVNVNHLESQAKNYCRKIKNKSACILSAGYLSGNADLLSKQLNWNAKQFASFFLVPDAMHHLCEGVIHPRKFNQLIFIILVSSLLNNADRLSLNLAAKYLKNQHLPLLKINCLANTRTASVINTMILSSFISFHLSMKYRQNPTPTPAIKYYKLHLK